MRQPFRLVGVVFEIEAGNEGFVAADDDHDQQVGDHHDVDQAEDDQHDFGFGEVAAGERTMDEVAQFDHEQPAVDHLGDDQAEVERRLDPAAGEDEGLKGFDE